MAPTQKFFLGMTMVLALVAGRAHAEEPMPGNGWATLDHASVVRTDKQAEVLYQVVTATVYGKRLANGAVVPKLLVLRERTAARCADESCLYRYSTFELGTPESRADKKAFAGKPIELDAAFTRHQMPADYIVTAVTLEEQTKPCGKRLWTVKADLEEGVTVEFAGEAIAARPNPKFQSALHRRP